MFYIIRLYKIKRWRKIESLLIKINSYLNKEAITGKDVIIISVLSSFVFLLLKGLFRSLFNRIKDLIMKLMDITLKRIKYVYRKYVKRSLTMEELIDINIRLESGGKLRWYEKKGYDNFVEQFKKINKLKKRDNDIK